MNLSDFPKVIFANGKGGVGKSTISSIIATALANSGKKTLLISTDPAHNISDIFEIEIKDYETKVNDNLFLTEINARKQVEDYIEEIRKNISKLISNNSNEMLDDYLISASKSESAEESALFDYLSDLITTDEKYDHIVVDTAPTGHTLRLFAMPKNLRDWAKNMLSQQNRSAKAEDILGHIALNKTDKKLSEDKSNTNRILIDKMESRYLKYSKFRNILIDSSKSAIIFVLNPTKLSIEETKRAIHFLHHEDIKPFAIVVNKILKDISKDGFYKDRENQSSKYMQIIEKEFDFKLIKVYLQNQDIVGMKNIIELSKKFIKSMN